MTTTTRAKNLNEHRFSLISSAAQYFKSFPDFGAGRRETRRSIWINQPTVKFLPQVVPNPLKEDLTNVVDYIMKSELNDWMQKVYDDRIIGDKVSATSVYIPELRSILTLPRRKGHGHHLQFHVHQVQNFNDLMILLTLVGTVSRSLQRLATEAGLDPNPYINMSAEIRISRFNG